MINDQLLTSLRAGLCSVVFTKTNGDERVMTCTLSPDLIPVNSYPKNNEVKPVMLNSEVLRVYDTESNGWRSFRWDSLISWEVVN